jgi:D-glycero-D-manno-heptose 1,7-bisphosphate phosphatase
VGIGAVSRPAVFLDRDGVLVEEVLYPETGEVEAPLRPEDVRLLPNAVTGARLLAAADYPLVVISNQAGYAKGKTTLRSLWLTHQKFIELLAAEGITLEGIFYSYTHPAGVVRYFSGPSLDRKPGPYNVFVAAAQLDLDLTSSWLVGDRETDVICAEAAGVKPILIARARHVRTRSSNIFIADDLVAAATFILSGRGTPEHPAPLAPDG